MHQISTLVLLAAAVFSMCSCASKPEQPSTTNYDQQVTRQANDEFNEKLNKP